MNRKMFDAVFTNNSWVYYSEADRSFDTEPRAGGDLSFLIGFVELVISPDRILVDIKGFSPKELWLSARLTIPRDGFSSPYSLKLASDYEYGIARLDKMQHWNTFWDQKNNYVCIGLPNEIGHCASINNNSFAVISHEGNLNAIWIKPIWR